MSKSEEDKLSEIEPKANSQFADTVEVVPCPGCGDDRWTHVVTGREMLRELEEPFDIVRCVSCGLKYTSPRPRLEFLGKYYPDDYYRENGQIDTKRRPGREKGVREHWTLTTLREHFNYPGKRNGLAWLVSLPHAWRLRYGRKYFNAVPWVGQGRLLDFGFGDGRFLRLQRDRGWTVTGIDFNPSVVKWAREEDGIDAYVGAWPGPCVQDKTFDTITAWHVLEHVPDPPGWFKSAFERLAPGGQLIICCPDSDSWAYRWFGIYWFGLDLPRHFSHYTKHDLKRLIEQAGMKVTRIRPQVRQTTIRRSAEYRARYTGSSLWKCLARFRLLWKVVSMLSGLAGKADCVILYASKPQ